MVNSILNLDGEHKVGHHYTLHSTYAYRQILKIAIHHPNTGIENEIGDRAVLATSMLDFSKILKETADSTHAPRKLLITGKPTYQIHHKDPAYINSLSSSCHTGSVDGGCKTGFCVKCHSCWVGIPALELVDGAVAHCKCLLGKTRTFSLHLQMLFLQPELFSGYLTTHARQTSSSLQVSSIDEQLTQKRVGSKMTCAYHKIRQALDVQRSQGWELQIDPSSNRIHAWWKESWASTVN